MIKSLWNKPGEVKTVEVHPGRREYTREELTRMSDKELDNIQYSREDYNIKTKLEQKIQAVARTLGSCTSGTHKFVYEIITEQLLVELVYDMYGTTSVVTFKGKQVYNLTEGKFIPGLWLDLIDSAMNIVDMKVSQQNQEAKAEARKQRIEEMCL